MGIHGNKEISLVNVFLSVLRRKVHRFWNWGPISSLKYWINFHIVKIGSQFNFVVNFLVITFIFSLIFATFKNVRDVYVRFLFRNAFKLAIVIIRISHISASGRILSFSSAPLDDRLFSERLRTRFLLRSRWGSTGIKKYHWSISSLLSRMLGMSTSDSCSEMPSN
jgi:hypothetical protein